MAQGDDIFIPMRSKGTNDLTQKAQAVNSGQEFEEFKSLDQSE